VRDGDTVGVALDSMQVARTLPLAAAAAADSIAAYAGWRARIDGQWRDKPGRFEVVAYELVAPPPGGVAAPAPPAAYDTLRMTPDESRR
jgi:hypothetical protein